MLIQPRATGKIHLLLIEKVQGISEAYIMTLLEAEVTGRLHKPRLLRKHE